MSMSSPQAAPPDSIDLTVIVVNWNAAAYLPDALASLFAALDDLQSEVLFIDNASTDGSVALVQQQYPQVRVLVNAENRGFAAANNQGLAQARGRYVLLLNPDTELPSSALHRLTGFLDEQPQVGVVGPRLEGERGKIQGGAAGFDPSPVTIFNYALFLYRLFPQRLRGLWLPQSAFRQSQPIEVDWVSGACMCARAEAVRQAGPMDERYFMYSEDVEWCRRIRRAGFKVYCHPGVHVIHHIGGSSRQLGPDFHTHNIDSLDMDLRSRYGAAAVALMHMFGALGFLIRYLLYEALLVRYHNPVFAELRDLWLACLRTSLVRIIRPARRGK